MVYISKYIQIDIEKWLPFSIIIQVSVVEQAISNSVVDTWLWAYASSCLCFVDLIADSANHTGNLI